MPDYSKTIIYKIFCKDSNVTELYIGHTTNFNKRKNAHRKNCNNENNRDYNFKVYEYIRANKGWDNFEMVIIENYSCNNIYEALEREGYWIKDLKATLNKIIAGRTKKEYRKDNKEKIKEYRIINKEKAKEYNKEYRIINKEKAKEYQQEYRIINKEKAKEYQQEYYKNKNDKLNKKHKEYYQNNKEKIICECGCEIIKNNLKNHMKTTKHINLMSNK